MKEVEKEKGRIRRKAEELLRHGFYSPDPDPELRVGEPLPVMHPNGGQHSWFVPLIIGHKLGGFAQILPSLEPLRFSSFQRHPGTCEDCPDVADWTDVQRILSRAATLAKEDEELSQPVLSYDQNPSRLAWRVLARSSSGAVRPILVAGTAVFEENASRGLG